MFKVASILELLNIVIKLLISSEKELYCDVCNKFLFIIVIRQFFKKLNTERFAILLFQFMPERHKLKKSSF